MGMLYLHLTPTHLSFFSGTGTGSTSSGTGSTSTGTGSTSSGTGSRGPECGPGTYSLDGRNGAGDKACRQCPANSVGLMESGYVSTYCLCNPGYTGDLSFTWDGIPRDSSCTACGEGKFKISTGAYQCSSCTTSFGGDNSGSSVRGSSSQDSCLCNAGYEKPTYGPCEQCKAGKYKESRDQKLCTSCPSKTSSPPGSTSVSSCTPIICVPNTYSADCPTPTSGSQSQGVCKTLMVVGLVVGMML
jgi:hypothetical protein